ncbi:hypothetical protein Tcan_02016 [Toxocara canis]|uniref:39S ribosomal protein L33, mitochondrial n=1 Tax=Toxocara canis TaxID=6265 RepID=A0A0B2UYV5_TOXCA|nr:hypothetical protein Tcan_02016 [Toxocara canis]
MGYAEKRIHVLDYPLTFYVSDCPDGNIIELISCYPLCTFTRQSLSNSQETSHSREGADMGAKSKYVIVQLASVISGSTRVWVRERAAEKFAGIFYDPAIGRSVLFEETRRIKGKSELSKRVKKMYNIE